ncbi:TRAP transporter small permease [Bacillus piscicola]|uniref:TRAP transporter small permease n=1 Tax=Bacillus piscicola TaxID=1632684 RepID=UPI001F088A33|nr:TRAP transporter small permease [Bacillus piscicola]
MAHKLTTLYHTLLDIMSYLGRALLVAIALLIALDVLFSNLLNQSIPWVLEVTEYSLVFLTFLGAAWLLRDDGHIKFDLVLQYLPGRAQYLFRIISSLIGFFVSLVITFFGSVITIEMYHKAAYTDAILQVPRFILLFIIPIGFLFITIEFLRNMVTLLTEKKGTRGGT